MEGAPPPKRLKVVVIRPGDPALAGEPPQRTVLGGAANSDQGTEATSEDDGVAGADSSDGEAEVGTVSKGDKGAEKGAGDGEAKPEVAKGAAAGRTRAAKAEAAKADLGETPKAEVVDAPKAEEKRETRPKGGRRKAKDTGAEKKAKGYDPETAATEMCEKLTNGHSLRKMAQGNVTGKKKVSLPAQFARSISSVGGPVKLVDVDGKREWTLMLRVSGDHGCRLSGGWPQFVRDIGLDEGDVVVFERVADKKAKVHIFKKDQ